MDVVTLMEAVSTVGFPIAMCVLLLWYINKQTEEHQRESRYFTSAINQNTNAITKLTYMIEKLSRQEDKNDN